MQKKHAARFFKWEQKMKVSARNQLKGKIAEVTKGATTSHVLIELGFGWVPDFAGPQADGARIWRDGPPGLTGG